MRRLPIMSGLLVVCMILVLSPTSARSTIWTAKKTTLDLLAGPGGTAAYLAPDGSRFAYFSPDNLCLYTVYGEQQDCFNFEDMDIRIDVETPRWSPDGTKIAFSEPFLITFKDSNIWMFDTLSGRLHDMSNDPTRGEKIPLGEPALENLTLDLTPQWSADSQFIYFIRYTFKQVSDALPSFYRLNVANATAEEVAPVTANNPLSTYGFALSPDNSRIAFNRDTRDNEPQDGTWFLDLSDNQARFGAAAVAETIPYTYQFSSDGDQVLVIGQSQAGIPLAAKPDQSPIYTLPFSGGRQQSLNVDRYVFSAGWGPEGTLLAYTTFDPDQPENEGLYITSQAGVAGEMVLPGRYFAPTGRTIVPLWWAANNTLLLTEAPDLKLAIVQLKPE